MAVRCVSVARRLGRPRPRFWLFAPVPATSGFGRLVADSMCTFTLMLTFEDAVVAVV